MAFPESLWKNKGRHYLEVRWGSHTTFSEVGMGLFEDKEAVLLNSNRPFLLTCLIQDHRLAVWGPQGLLFYIHLPGP